MYKFSYKYENLNGHDIRVRQPENTDNAAEPMDSDIVYPGLKKALRIKEDVVGVEAIGGVMVRTTKLGEIDGLPEPKEGIMYIVSMPLAERAYALGRRDCVAPDTNNDAVSFRLPNGQNGTYAVRYFRFIDGGY